MTFWVKTHWVKTQKTLGQNTLGQHTWSLNTLGQHIGSPHWFSVVYVGDNDTACVNERRRVSSKSPSLARTSEEEGARKWTRLDPSIQIYDYIFYDEKMACNVGEKAWCGLQCTLQCTIICSCADTMLQCTGPRNFL